MRKVLFVSPALEPNGSARRLLLLIRTLRAQVEPSLIILGQETPWSQALRNEGIRVEALPQHRLIDCRQPLTLRRLVQEFQPDLLHTWGWSALGNTLLAGVRWPGQLLASALLPADGKLSWPALGLLRQVGQVVAFGQAETLRYRRLGISPNHLATLPLAVEVPAVSGPSSLPSLPDDARLILGIGPIHHSRGFRDAVWIFDILRHAMPNLHLALVGSGPDRDRVRRFARNLQLAEVVHLPGPVEDVGPWLARAEMVWVPSLRDGGVTGALEAMAAGKPVIASQLPGLIEVMGADTELLVRPGDKPMLARVSKGLLDNPAREMQIASAGLRRVQEQFSLAGLAQAAGAFYRTGDVSRRAVAA